MLIIYAPYFTAGVVHEHGVVTNTAPIVKYMIGWPRLRVLSYAAKKGWDVFELDR